METVMPVFNHTQFVYIAWQVWTILHII